MLDTDLGGVIAACRSYRPHGGEFLLRASTGRPLCAASLSARFCDARVNAGVVGQEGKEPPTLHECRSLSERLYREQGIDTKTLLGHTRQAMTDAYNDDRGLTANDWRTLTLL